MTTLFESQAYRPLSDRLRPDNLDEVVGQEQLLSANAPLRRMIEKDRMSSIILCGPPGTGKTTIARLLASTTNSHFESISAVFSGVADLRNVFNNAKNRREIGAGSVAKVVF